MTLKETRVLRVKEFREACLQSGFTELAPHVYELESTFEKTLTFCTLIHGNEIGGIETFFDFLKVINLGKLSLRSNLRLILGNVEAYFEDKRFLETDMNRSFDLSAPKTAEELRAKDLERFLSDSNVLVDVHQTIGPTKTPFFIFEYEDRSYRLARCLDQHLPVITYTTKRAFEGKTTTGFVIDKGQLGITIETGQKGVNDIQRNLGLDFLMKAAAIDFTQNLSQTTVQNTYTFSQVLNNPTRTFELVRKFDNFDPIKKGEVLAKYQDQEVRATEDGVILFPKYGDYAKAAIELALVLRPVTSIADL